MLQPVRGRATPEVFENVDFKTRKVRCFLLLIVDVTTFSTSSHPALDQSLVLMES